MGSSDVYLSPCPKCGGRNIRIWIASKEVVCSDCGRTVDVPSETLNHVMAKEWNSAAKDYIPPTFEDEQ